MSSDNSGAPAAPKVVTLAEAIITAQHLQRSLKFDAAEGIYQEVLGRFPEEPNALHYLGVLRHQQGRNDEAVELIRRAIARLPGDAGPWLNLGNVLLESQRYDDAVDAYKQAADYAPGNVLIFSNLGVLHTRRNSFEAAEACYKHALSLAPNAEPVLHNYARMLQNQGRYEEATAYNIKSLDINPDDPKARRMLSMSQALLGDMEAARAVLHEWLARDPGNAQATHLLAAAGGLDAPARASNDFIAAEFDGFSNSFDSKLERLGYRAPQLVVDALTRAMAPATSTGTILDAGCGTGLCGPYLRPLAKWLDGVDLSAGMLAKARGRGGYDSLAQAELTEYLAQNTTRWDAVVSADTLCYFGDLSPVLEAARRALNPRGLLAFSVEALADEDAEYRLHYHGRYAHSRTYVERCLRAAGLVPVTIDAAVLRLEVQRPVQGWIAVAKNP